MSLYATIAFFAVDETYFEPAEIFLLLVQIVILTILIPGAVFLFLRSIGLLDSMMAENLNQRKIPLAVQAILIIILIYQGVILDRLPELYFFFKGVLASLIIALLFLFAKTKISLHMLGLGGLLFFVMAISYYNRENSLTLIAFLIAVTGLTATSRLYLNAHNNKELLIGFFSGIIPQVAFWGFWL